MCEALIKIGKTKVRGKGQNQTDVKKLNICKRENTRLVKLAQLDIFVSIKRTIFQTINFQDID